jgi:hypothetical protein
MADELRSVLSGQPGQQAKPADDNVQLTVTAPPDVLNRVATFITVQDWPSGSVGRGTDCKYSCDTVENTARSFFYACSTEDYECISGLLSPGVLAQLKGTNINPFRIVDGDEKDAQLIQELRGNWKGKDAAIRQLVKSWNRYPLRQIRVSGAVAIGFGLRYFASVSFEGAPEDFVELNFIHDGDGHRTNALVIDTMPPWPPATEAASQPGALPGPTAAGGARLSYQWYSTTNGPIYRDTPVHDQTTELTSAIEDLVRRAAVHTGYNFELWEKVPRTPGEYRIRTGVRRASIPMTTGRQRAEIFFLVASNRYYIQLDPIGASTLHYYGPFEGDPWRTLPIPEPSAEEMARDLAARFEAAKNITGFPQRDAAMAAVSLDAARAGNIPLAKKAIQEIVAFTTRDNAASEAARELLKTGHRADALEIAHTITSFVTRDAVLRELAE